MENAGDFPPLSPEHLRVLADAVPQIIWTNDAQGTANYFNRRWYEFTGLSFEESKGVGWEAVVHPDDASATKARWADALNRGETFDSARRLRAANGEYRWFIGRNVPLKDESGQVTSWFGTDTDIQELKNAQADLEAASERLRLLMDSALEHAIIGMNLDRQVVSWNPGARNIIGFEVEEIVGQTADVIFTQLDREACLPEMEAQRAIQNGRSEDNRWHLRKDGQRFFANGVMLPMHSAPDGPLVGLLKILRDDTAAENARLALARSRAELENALRQTKEARAEAEEANRAKDHFLAILSHELRTPLSPIIMGSELLKQDPNLSSEAKRILEMIQRNIKLEARLIDDLLDVTRITRGAVDIGLMQMDLHQVVNHAIEIAQPDVLGRGLHLTVQLEAVHHQMMGDPARLQQVVWNILKNACKFTPCGGKILIHTWNETPAAITVEVIDTGLGIEPDAIQNIFRPFTQANIAIAGEYGGLGLGLSICKATVDAHGGTIMARSDGLGRGSAFIINLPLNT